MSRERDMKRISERLNENDILTHIIEENSNDITREDENNLVLTPK